MFNPPISVWLSVDMVYNDKDLKVSFLANLWLSGLFYLGWKCFHLTATARSNFPNLQVVSVKDCINRLFAFGQKWTVANIILDSCWHVSTFIFWDDFEVDLSCSCSMYGIFVVHRIIDWHRLYCNVCIMCYRMTQIVLYCMY